MNRTFLSMLVGLIIILSSLNVRADKTDVEQLNAMLASIQSMDAQFSQLVLNARGHVMQEVRGQLTIQRPYKFRWITGEPFFQNIISNGQLLWVHDLDLEQVTVQTLDRRLGNTPALLLSGDPTQIAKAFDIRRETALGLQNVGDAANTTVVFRLQPKDSEGLFESLTVTFKNQSLFEMYLKDSLGQQTTIEFSDVKNNVTIDASVFEFSPPEGVDIIEDF